MRASDGRVLQTPEEIAAEWEIHFHREFGGDGVAVPLH